MQQQKPISPNILQVIISLGLFLFLAFAFTSKLDLPIQLALFLGWFIIIVLGIYLGHSYLSLEKAAIKGIGNGMNAILI